MFNSKHWNISQTFGTLWDLFIAASSEITGQVSDLFHGQLWHLHLQKCRRVSPSLGGPLGMPGGGRSCELRTRGLAFLWGRRSYTSGTVDVIVEICKTLLAIQPTSLHMWILVTNNESDESTDDMLSQTGHCGAVQATKGGLYASSLMSWMMSHGEDFYGLPVNCRDVALVSTPPQLEDFVRKVSSGQVLVPGTQRGNDGKTMGKSTADWNAPAMALFFG